MPLTKEQLLIPRYKVIADDTSDSFKVGEIIIHPIEWHDWIWQTESGKIIFNPEKYPHLFQPLPWWSDREINDLPEYIKRCDGSVVRVLHYGYSEAEGELYLVMDDLEIPNYMDYLDPQPSNLEEYIAYINQKQQ